MVADLHDLRITEVSFCRKPMNKFARIALAKADRDDDAGGDLPYETLIDAIQSVRKCSRLEAAIEAHRQYSAAERETVAKSQTAANVNADAAEAELDKLAKRHAAEHSVSFAKAYDAVLATDAGRELYRRYRA